ncbi:MAG: hypothetical protein QXV82_10100 [Ignisphaera sp.]
MEETLVMGILSTKQLDYVRKLAERNAVILQAIINTENEHAGRLLQDALRRPLYEPMSKSEESIRRRLKKKLQKYAKALAILDLAGITPAKGNKNYQSLEEYVRALIDQLYSELVTLLETGKKEAIDAWIAARISEMME